MPLQTAAPYVITYPDPADTIEVEDLQDLATTVRTALGQAVVDAGQAAVDAFPQSARDVVAQLFAPGASTDLTWPLGDGTASSFTITHNLGSRRFALDVYATSGAFDTVTPDVRRPSVDTVVVDFGSYVPAPGEFELVIVPRGVVRPVDQNSPSVEYVQALTAPLPKVELRYVGTRLAQVAETRPDGSVNVWTLTYSGDAIIGATTSNPVSTVTFTGTSAAPAGWAVN